MAKIYSPCFWCNRISSECDWGIGPVHRRSFGELSCFGTELEACGKHLRCSCRGARCFMNSFHHISYQVSDTSCQISDMRPIMRQQARIVPSVQRSTAIFKDDAVFYRRLKSSCGVWR